ncbi:MAG: hypothetical protein ACKVK8_10130 [Rhodospirillales bacterium]
MNTPTSTELTDTRRIVSITDSAVNLDPPSDPGVTFRTGLVHRKVTFGDELITNQIAAIVFFRWKPLKFLQRFSSQCGDDA